MSITPITSDTIAYQLKGKVGEYNWLDRIKYKFIELAYFLGFSPDSVSKVREWKFYSHVKGLTDAFNDRTREGATLENTARVKRCYDALVQFTIQPNFYAESLMKAIKNSKAAPSEKSCKEREAYIDGFVFFAGIEREILQGYVDTILRDITGLTLNKEKKWIRTFIHSAALDKEHQEICEEALKRVLQNELPISINKLKADFFENLRGSGDLLDDPLAKQNGSLSYFNVASHFDQLVGNYKKQDDAEDVLMQSAVDLYDNHMLAVEKGVDQLLEERRNALSRTYDVTEEENREIAAIKNQSRLFLSIERDIELKDLPPEFVAELSRVRQFYRTEIQEQHQKEFNRLTQEIAYLRDAQKSLDHLADEFDIVRQLLRTLETKRLAISQHVGQHVGRRVELPDYTPEFQRQMQALIEMAQLKRGMDRTIGEAQNALERFKGNEKEERRLREVIEELKPQSEPLQKRYNELRQQLDLGSMSTTLNEVVQRLENPALEIQQPISFEQGFSNFFSHFEPTIREGVRQRLKNEEKKREVASWDKKIATMRKILQTKAGLIAPKVIDLSELKD